jgi:hypothetical protein
VACKEVDAGGQHLSMSYRARLNRPGWDPADIPRKFTTYVPKKSFEGVPLDPSLASVGTNVLCERA